MKVVFVAALLWGAATSVAQPLTEDRVLLLYNSPNAESLAVRDAYVAAHPGVVQFDLNDPTIPEQQLNRNQFNNKIRDPLRAVLQGTLGGDVLAERIIAIVTTRGLPARIDGAGEFTLAAQRASIESEIALLYQNLNATGSGSLPFLYSGVIDNPYHTLSSTQIASFDRSSIQTVRPFTRFTVGPSQDVWRIDGLTPGDIYLVCRLDACPGATTTAVEETIRLIERSTDPVQMVVQPNCVQALLDEFPPGSNQLDDDGAPPLFPNSDDFDLTAAILQTMGVSTLHDETTNFVTGPELPETTPLLVVGTYGENHDVGGAGDDPPGIGTFINTYTPHPAGVFLSYESFSGNCIYNGTQRQGQACATEWITNGGSFTIVTITEPFTFAITDLADFIPALYLNGLTFAEAAYASLPALSWANTPIGDPLARVVIAPPSSTADFNADGVVGPNDLATMLTFWNSPTGDLSGDGTTDSEDLAILLAAWGPTASCP